MMISSQKLLEKSLRETFKKTVLENKWIPHKPHPKQAEFLILLCREALYGGAAGGGKTNALLMGALQFVDVPGYSAILFRRTYKDLALPDAIMDRAHQWLQGTKARWKGDDYVYIFPSGAKLTFGYMKTDMDRYRYQGAEFQSIGFDEETQFTEIQYTYLFSRLRRGATVNIPLRMRGASNPGGVGHDWVKRRFLIEGPSHGRVFIPAKLDDNPSLDREQYRKSLMELDPVTRLQLLEGDWEARHGGSIFKREWFDTVNVMPVRCRVARYWDLASTQPRIQGRDPSYTVGVKMGELNGTFYIDDVVRGQWSPQQVEQIVAQTAQLDGYDVQIYMEIEPGSSGVSLIDHYRRNVLLGYAFRGHKTTGSKELRAIPLSASAEAGSVKIVGAHRVDNAWIGGEWIGSFLQELEAFPYGSHADQVDASSGCFTVLAVKKSYPRAVILA